MFKSVRVEIAVFSGETPYVGFPSKTSHWDVFSPFPAFWEVSGISPVATGDQEGLCPPEPPTTFYKRWTKIFVSRESNCVW